MVEALAGLVQLPQHALAPVGQLAHQSGSERNAAVVCKLCQGSCRAFARLAVVQLDEGQPGHALVAQRGKSAGADGGQLIDRNAHQHLAPGLGVQADAGDLAHRHALVTHIGLGLQAAQIDLTGQFIAAQLACVARQPNRQGDQQGGDKQDKQASGQRV